MPTMYERGVEAATAANDEYDNATLLYAEIVQTEIVLSTELPRWALFALHTAVERQRTMLVKNCEMFRYYNDQAEYFFSWPPGKEYSIEDSRLGSWMTAKHESIENGLRNYGSPTLDAIAG